ncbi:hypothetical protein [Synechococcus sp. PCC 6312]|uniref:hypothetical protein n=1 Tax=Synechococcus sp. (strain ATCC 27167 / PCC 6312) TaxID=195253 RepID=UPI00029EF12C|nr:hypothetical protein [Synechococcus sp. PCC 6312]AFY61693.1 hypothetical protein Syn6312_2595 [Synechococcus sp. PCC 6312]
MEDQKGIPIYLDKAKRKLSNLATEEAKINDWHPSNTPALHLWRCFDALEDINNLLMPTAILKDAEQSRRRAKLLVTPLYSLCVSIRDLCNYLQSAPEMRSKSNKAQMKTINKTLEDFLKVVPLDKTSAIRGVRDRLSAHVDRLMPYEAKNIFDRAKNHEIGTWLHQCILTLSQLLPLDVYGWTTDDCPEGYVRIMSVEPMLVTFKLEDNKPTMLAGLHISSSPKKQILETCNKVLKTSRWMFRKGDQYILSLTEETISLKESI